MDKLEEVEELELSSNKNDETTENSEDKNVNEVTLKQDNVIEEIKDGEKEDSEALEKEDTAEEHTATVLEMDTPLEDSTKSDIEEPKTKKDKLHKYTIAITIISIILFIGLAIFSTAFALANKFSDKIVSGISISGIDVSGLTYDEAKEKVSKIYDEKIKQDIILKHNDYETSLIPEQIEANFNLQEALDTAYSIGRSGKVLKDNYTIINARLNKIDIKPAFSYNENALTEFINSTSTNLPDAVKQSSYSVENNNVIITKGQKGVVINLEELKTSIVNNIVNLKQETESIEIPVVEKEPDEIDLQKIHDEIYKEAKDAYYTKDPFVVYPHVEGVDFGISMEEAQNLLNNEEAQIIIPLKKSMPNVTTNEIGTEAFPDLLASYSTTFATSNKNRTTNIKLASNKINGVVLMPGEQFSFNEVVGKRTAAAGYKTAAVYVAGKVENGIGGGICQVSSTLYNTALRANLEIVKRSNHRFATGYVPLSTDATVSWGGPEFIFKNSRKYPIKITSTVNGGKITVNIYGCKEEVEYEVVIKSETLQTIPMKTEYRTNTSLPKGTQRVVQKGHGGYKSRAYRILKLNGKEISRQLLSTDTYAQLSTIIEKN